MACKRDIKVLLIDKVAELSKTNSISKVNTMFGTEVIKPSGRIFIPSSLIDTYWNKYNEVKNKPVTPERREISLTPNVKPGVAELFESNPELANAVYEALGFNKQINEIADTKKIDEYIKKYKEALPNIKDGKTLISHLQTISNRNSGTTKQFSDLIIKLSKSNKGLEKLLNNPNLYAKPNSVGDEGAFHWSLFSNLSVNKIVLELDHFKTNTYDDVFLHELIHNLTTQFIVKDSDLFNQNFYNKVKELYSIFDNYLENNRTINEPLLNSTKEDIKNIKRLIEYFEFLPNDAIQQELLFGKIGSVSTVKGVKLDYKSLENKPKNEVLQELNNLLNFKESRLKDIEKGDKDYYYFNSKTFKQENVLSEFLATFMNDANFREQLKNIDYKNNKSIFQSIIDLISEFIGLTKNDSLYNEFVLTLTNFINNNDYSTIAEQTQKTAYQNRINLLEQQKQQAQQLYSQYLDTIFPDSKVKDIVYHGTEGEKFNVVDFTKNIFKRTAFYVSIFKDEAQLYAGKNGNIIPLLINAKNIQFQRDAFFGNRPETIEELTEQLQNINKAKYALQFIGEEIYVTTFNSLEEANDYAERNSGWEPLEKLVKNQKIEELTNLLNNLKLQGEFDTVLTNNDGNQKSIYIVNKSEQVHILGNNNDIEGFKQFVSGRLGQQGNIFYQNLSESNLQDYVASEKTIRDLAARMSDRIGIPVLFEFDTTKEYKGKLKNNTAIINLAYATLDTPIHEILGHPIIRAIKNKEKFNLAYSDSKIINGKFFINNKEITKDEYFDLHKKFENNNFKISQLYQNLLKELETGKGKEVFDRIKRDYDVKTISKNYSIIDKSKNTDLEIIQNFGTYWFKEYNEVFSRGKQFDTNEELQSLIEREQNKIQKYTLEEQQEEAIVELLGLYTADRLDKVKDGKLISLLKRLLKEMKAFMKSLFNQKEVEIDKLPDNMTLGDLADLLAYSNSKLILPGNEVLYTIGDGLKFKTYAEINNHIKELARQAAKYENVDLSKVEIDNEDIYLKRFLEADKEYAQAREIIDTWKEVNDIQYNPEEAYSRGQEFIHVHNAYGNTDTITWLQNLIPNLEDINKANGVMEMSFLTYFQGKLPKHVTRHLNEKAVIKIIAYPKSKDIAFASKTDNHTSSYSLDSKGLQYFIDLSKISKREQLAVNYTKSIKLLNIGTIEPNIADTIDNVAHHNEYAINIADGNFRIEYGKETPYDIKKLIDNINSILDQKYGKLVKPEIKKENIREEFTYKVQLLDEDGYLKADVKSGFKTLEEAKQWAEENKDDYIKWSGSFNYEKVITKKIGIEPTQTNETLKESIESVKNKTLGIFDNSKYVHPELGFMDGYNNFESDEFKLDTDTFKLLYNVDKKTYNVVKKFPNYWQAVSKSNLEYYSNIKGVQVSKIIEEQKKLLNEKIEKYNKKEYTSQALINTKVAALKQVAKKYPRSLIRSEIVKIKIKKDLFDISFQKISTNKDIEMKTLPDDIKGEYDIFLDELNDSDVNPIFKGTQGETLVDENNNLCALK